MKARELQNIIRLELARNNKINENKDCGCSKKRNLRENTMLTEGKKNCCHDDNYNDECCDGLYKICCDPPVQSCCDDMPNDKIVKGPKGAYNGPKNYGA